MAGIPVESADFSEKVLYDLRKTIGELVADNFTERLPGLPKNTTSNWVQKNVAPVVTSDALLHYKYVDYPSGEFWLKSPTHDKPLIWSMPFRADIFMEKTSFRPKLSRLCEWIGTNIPETWKRPPTAIMLWELTDCFTTFLCIIPWRTGNRNDFGRYRELFSKETKLGGNPEKPGLIIAKECSFSCKRKTVIDLAVLLEKIFLLVLSCRIVWYRLFRMCLGR